MFSSSELLPGTSLPILMLFCVKGWVLSAILIIYPEFQLIDVNYSSFDSARSRLFCADAKRVRIKISSPSSNSSKDFPPDWSVYRTWDSCYSSFPSSAPIQKRIENRGSRRVGWAYHIEGIYRSRESPLLQQPLSSSFSLSSNPTQRLSLTKEFTLF